jgi:hypothetical protein
LQSKESKGRGEGWGVGAEERAEGRAKVRQREQQREKKEGRARGRAGDSKEEEPRERQQGKKSGRAEGEHRAGQREGQGDGKEMNRPATGADACDGVTCAPCPPPPCGHACLRHFRPCCPLSSPERIGMGPHSRSSSLLESVVCLSLFRVGLLDFLGRPIIGLIELQAL